MLLEEEPVTPHSPPGGAGQTRGVQHDLGNPTQTEPGVDEPGGETTKDNAVSLRDERESEAKQIMASLAALRTSIPEATRKINRSFSSIIWMNWLAFVISLGLIGVLIYQLIVGEASWEYLAAGGGGLLVLLFSFLTKPQLRLQRSMFNLARLQTALYAWFSHFNNWDVFITNVTLKDKQSDRVLGLIKQSGTDIAYQTKKLFELIEDLEDDLS
jgi:hypothetical protein